MHGRFSAGLIAATLALLAPAGLAQAADPAITVGPDGTTAATFSYTDAIGQRVFSPVPAWIRIATAPTTARRSTSCARRSPTRA